MSKKSLRWCVPLLLLGWQHFSLAQATANLADVALVTSLAGEVSRGAGSAANKVEAFVKLKNGDSLSLGKDARIQLVYFENGRQELWTGAGKLLVGQQESRGSGLAAAQIRQLPLNIVRQISRTPALVGQGRAGTMRLRSINTAESAPATGVSVDNSAALARLEEGYAQLRAAAAASDLTPELYLLAGLQEMGLTQRLEQALLRIGKEYSANPEAQALVSGYRVVLGKASAP